MKSNLTALMMLLMVQLVLWKVVSTINHTFLRDTQTKKNTKVSTKEWTKKTPIVSYMTTLKGHALTVTSAAITADNNRVISGSQDNTIKVWNLGSSQLERTLSGHTGTVNYLSVTPDGKHIVSAESKSVRIWNLQTGALIRKLENSGTISFVRTSQDGKTLVMDGGTQIEKGTTDVSDYSYSEEQKKYIISIFNLQTGTLKRQLVHDNSLTKVQMSLSGNILVSGDSSGTLNIWNLQSGTLQKTLIGHESKIQSIAISPDEKTIVSTEEYGQIKIWDLNSGKLKITFSGHNDSILYRVRTVIPNNNTLVSWSNQQIKIWNLQNGNLKHTIKNPKDFGEFYFTSFDAKSLLIEENNGIQIWDLLTGKLTSTLEVKEKIITFSPDAKIIATRIGDNRINIWRITYSNK